MTSNANAVQSVLRECLAEILRPIVRLMLSCGMSYGEFDAVAKTTFVQVATEKYGIRGRPTNASRVAAMTGLPRKLVSKIRASSHASDWSPDKKIHPLNTIIHYWRFDEEFSHGPGVPRDLRQEGVGGFLSLVKRYAGDVPPGAIRQELVRSGIAVSTAEGSLRLVRHVSLPDAFDEDFVRNTAFTLANLGDTLAHNAELLRQDADIQNLSGSTSRFFERYAWSNRLSSDSIAEFRAWVRQDGAAFIQRADEWLARHELGSSSSDTPCPPTGVGVYFFLRKDH